MMTLDTEVVKNWFPKTVDRLDQINALYQEVRFKVWIRFSKQFPLRCGQSQHQYSLIKDLNSQISLGAVCC
jgi:hypothetical protein